MDYRRFTISSRPSFQAPQSINSSISALWQTYLSSFSKNIYTVTTCMLKHLGVHLISRLTGYRLSCSVKHANLVTILPAEDLRTVRRKAKMIVFKHLKSIFHRVLRKNSHTSEPKNFQWLPRVNLVQDPETTAAERRE